MSNQKMIKPEWIPEAYKDEESAGQPFQKPVTGKPATLLYKSMLILKRASGSKSKNWK